LTLGRLAERLGVKTPSLYNHVGGLPDIQCELALRAKRALCAQLARATVGKAQDDAMFALCEAFRAFIKKYPARYALTVRPSSADGHQDPEMQAADADIVEVVLATVASYGLAGDEALHAVRSLRSVVHGFSTLELTGGFGLPLDADTSFQMLCRMLVAGLRALAEDQRHRQG
jgi:AcrR family transcriptional regulator